jgi:hypothetical protein
MMGATHRAFAGTWWLAATLGLELIYRRAGAPAGAATAVSLAGYPLAPLMASGKTSPDVDHVWWPGPPRAEPGDVGLHKRRYYVWGHRGLTHRVWFAFVVTLVVGVLPALVLLRLGTPVYAVPLVLAPAVGWWSHLAGDMIYGRIRIAGTAVGLGWTTGGVSETGRRKGATPWLTRQLVPVDPAAKVCVAMSAVLAVAHVVYALS